MGLAHNKSNRIMVIHRIKERMDEMNRYGIAINCDSSSSSCFPPSLTVQPALATPLCPVSSLPDSLSSMAPLSCLKN